jgi:hypothetical protein
MAESALRKRNIRWLLALLSGEHTLATLLDEEKVSIWTVRRAVRDAQGYPELRDNPVYQALLAQRGLAFAG